MMKDHESDRRGNAGRVERLVFLSDFHLSERGFGWRASGRPPGLTSEAFIAFVRYLRHRARDEGGKWRLVLLGDVFDFLHPPGGRPEAWAADAGGGAGGRVRSILRANRGVFDALADAVADGFALDVVPGNHDMELVFPEIQQLMREAISGTAGAAAVTFHPWIFFVPGLVYAEHGHQYHDINAFRFPLEPSMSGDADALDHPIGAHVEAAVRRCASKANNEDSVCASERLGVVGALTRAALQYCLSSTGNTVAALGKRGHRSASLVAYATEIGLTREAVEAISDLSKTNLARIGLRAVRHGLMLLKRRAIAAASGATPEQVCYTAPYLHTAARAIDQVLRSEERSVPFFVFGHSHVAERVELYEHPGPTLLNPGTWTSLGPPGAYLPSTQGLFPWVEVVRDRDKVHSSIWLWNSNTGRREVAA